MRLTHFALSMVLVGACGNSGTSGTTTPAQAAARDLCVKVCACSSDCTIASVGTNGQPKEPIHFATQSACQTFYETFLTPRDGGNVDPTACSGAIAGATCGADSTGGHYLVPPRACAAGVTVVDAGAIADGGTD